MLKPAPHTRIALKETVRRIDRVAADLNVLLVVIALGLATLDFTCFVVQEAVASLPPITHISPDAPNPSAN